MSLHDGPPPHSRLCSVLLLTAILLAGLVMMSRSKADPDLWGHVQYGKEVLRDGYLHPVTTWSYAVDDHRWINHENIAELTMAAADVLAGQSGLLLLKSVLTLVVLGLPLYYAWRQGGGLLTCFTVMLILAFGISFHWLIRPHMFSYVSAAVLITLLSAGLPSVIHRRGTSGVTASRCLWAVPFVMCFWTNAHGGYLAGMAILAAWLGLDTLDLLFRKDPRFLFAVKHHATLFAVSCAACLVNPYGIELHQWMLTSLGRPRPEISEWAPLPLFSSVGLPFWVMALVSALSLSGSSQPRRWPGLVLLSLLAWQALSHHRHLPFLAIAASFVLMPHIESTFETLRRGVQEWFSWSEKQRSPVAGLIAGSALLVVLTVAQASRQAQLHVDRGFYPVSAMQYMHDHQLGGRVLVTFNWAQYALASFAATDPESRIAIDGRFRTCYPQPVIDMYFDLILGEHPPAGRYRESASGPFDPFRALEFGYPDLVLLERDRHPQATRTIRQADGWTLLYQDSLAELWGRSEQFDNPQSADWLSPLARHIGNDLQEGTLPWPAFPQSS